MDNLKSLKNNRRAHEEINLEYDHRLLCKCLKKKYDHRLLDKCLTKQNAFFCNVKVTASHSKTLNNSAY